MQGTEKKAPIVSVGTLQDFFIDRSALAKLEVGGKVMYSGFMGLMPDIFRGYQVKQVYCEPEIRRKDWEYAGFMPPMNPELLPQYSFADLDMKLYYKIVV